MSRTRCGDYAMDLEPKAVEESKAEWDRRLTVISSSTERVKSRLWIQDGGSRHQGPLGHRTIMGIWG